MQAHLYLAEVAALLAVNSLGHFTCLPGFYADLLVRFSYAVSAHLFADHVSIVKAVDA